MAILEEEVSARKDALTLTHIPLGLIRPSALNPRSLFDEEAVQSLADSIRARGVLSPIAVRLHIQPQAEGPTGYQIIAGERRFRAAQLAGLTEIPAFVHEVSGDDDALVLTLIENLQREQLNPMEAARGYQQLTDMGYSQERIVRECGGSVPNVSNTLGLLKLPLAVQDLIAAGTISFSHGKLLRPLFDRVTQANGITLAQEAADGGWPVKRLEAEIDHRFPKPPPAPALLDVPEDPAEQSGFAPPGPLPLTAQGDNAPKSAAETLAALNQERDETVKGWNDAADDEQDGEEADDDADQPAPAADVDPAGEGREDVPAGAEGGPVPEPAAVPDAARPAGDADPQRGRRPDPPAKSAGNSVPVPATPKNPAAPAPAVKPPAPNTGGAIAQPAGTVSHVVLLTQELDDWLWDKNWTPLEAITAMHRIVSAGLYLTPAAEQAATVLTHQYNERHPDVPISPYLQIEATLAVRASAAGFTVPEIMNEEEYLHGSPAAEPAPDTTEEN